MNNEITISFSVPPEMAQELVDDIAEARESGGKWEFTGHFEIEDAIEIQAQLQKQLRDTELAEDYESYNPK